MTDDPAQFIAANFRRLDRDLILLRLESEPFNLSGIEARALYDAEARRFLETPRPLHGSHADWLWKTLT